MMTGILTVSKLRMLYYILCLLASLAFSIHDIRTRRVPNKGLVFFFCLAMLRPVGGAMGFLHGKISGSVCAGIFLDAAFGFLAGLVILLAAAILTGGGTGLGGGDIKYCSVLGVVYGIQGLCTVLFAAALLVLPAAVLYRKRVKDKVLSLPFLPFLFIGCLAETVILIMR